MIVYPNAKINLGLRVLRKRTDGFHELETVFYPVPLSDILEIVPSREGRLSFKLYGMELAGNPMDNLCVRAARLLMEEYEIPPVEIYLHKRIPAGAGLGGGSADAAFTLRALNELFALGLNDETLLPVWQPGWEATQPSSSITDLCLEAVAERFSLL